MKKLLFLLPIIIIPQLLVAQSQSSIDVTGGIYYAYRTLSGADDEMAFIETRNGKEEPKSYWTFGVHYNSQISDAWFVRTGVRSANITYDFFLGIVIDYRIIEVPILLRRQFSAKKWSHFVEFGISPSRLSAKENRRISIDFHEPKFQLVGIVSAGINYTTDSFQFFAQPTFRYHLTKSTIFDSLEEHLYSGGIELGVRKFLENGLD